MSVYVCKRMHVYKVREALQTVKLMVCLSSNIVLCSRDFFFFLSSFIPSERQIGLFINKMLANIKLIE